MLENTRRLAAPHAGYPWSVDSRFPLIRTLSAGGWEKKRLAFSSKSSSLSVTRKSRRPVCSTLSSPRHVFAGSMNGKTGPSSSFNDYYRPFRYSRETYIAATVVMERKEFLSCYDVLNLSLKKKLIAESGMCSILWDCYFYGILKIWFCLIVSQLCQLGQELTMLLILV